MSIIILGCDSDQWITLFDGETLDGWRASENVDFWKIRDGVLVTAGPRSHLFYEGEVMDHEFKNFEFVADVKTEPGSYVEYEMTGSIYAIRNTWKAPVADNEWFNYRIKVQGKTIQTFINGELVCEFTEPEEIYRSGGMEGREWVDLFSEETVSRFDYVFTDAMTWTNDEGRRMRLWIPVETEVGDPQDFMDREQLTLGSKIWTRKGGIPEAERPDADVVVGRFRKELDTDYLDLVQIHCMVDADWTDTEKKQMEIRAHGVSVHSLEAMKTALAEPWVDVIHQLHASGKGVISMKLRSTITLNGWRRRLPG